MTTELLTAETIKTIPTYKKEIIFDRDTRDYAMYIDGELTGFARTYHEAEVTLDQLVFELMSGQYFRADGPYEKRVAAEQAIDAEAIDGIFGPVTEREQQELQHTGSAAAAAPEEEIIRCDSVFDETCGRRAIYTVAGFHYCPECYAALEALDRYANPTYQLF